MAAVAELTSSIGPVTADSGDQIRRRREALGLSVRQLAELAGVDRSRITKLEAGEEVRGTIRSAVEQALAARARKIGADLEGSGDEDDGMVEIRGTGPRGMTFVVKGPVRDVEALRAAAERLVDEQSQKREGGN